MQVVKFPYGVAPDDNLVTELWEAGTAGLLEEVGSLQAYFPDHLDLHVLLGKYPTAIVSQAEAPHLIAHPNTDPVLIGKSFAVVEPSSGTSGLPIPPHRHVLHINASGAFGSGRHDSTQLVIEAMENLNLTGATVLDVGCGSAITSEAARLLGASHVIACDIHWPSLEQARNTFPQIPSFLGSADAIATASIDIVIANISASVIDLLAFHLARVTRTQAHKPPDAAPNKRGTSADLATPGESVVRASSTGTIILAGFVHNRLPESFVPTASRVRHDWICWLTDTAHLVAPASPPCPQPFPIIWW